MNEQIEAFLRFLADERRLSANTLTAYRNDLRQFESHITRPDLPANGTSDRDDSVPSLVSEATRDHLVAFFLDLRERGYSPATIARKMAAVKSMFHYLHSRGDIRANPALLIDAPEVKKPLPRAITAAEIELLLLQANRKATPERLRDYAMLRVLCATGMRVTELVSLNLEDLDLAGRRICCTGRNGRRRELPIDDTVAEAIEAYRLNGRPILLRNEESNALFLNHRGSRLTRQGFWLIMKTMVRESGLTCEVTPHTLRHSFAAQRLQDGLELSRLRELLGHANISTTQIYTQVKVGAQPKTLTSGPRIR